MRSGNDGIRLVGSKGEVEMSTLSVKLLRSLCLQFVRDNAAGRLRSPLFNRSIAVREANDILALTQLRESRSWIPNDELGKLIGRLRETASTQRLTAEARVQALRRLAWIELNEPALGDDPTDQLIRKLVATKIGLQPSQGMSDIDRALAKYKEGKC
jgi:hypothetical protein